MSKPIKVVLVAVVIIIVVFVKKKIVVQNFDPKTIHVQNTFGLKVLNPKELLGKKMYVPKSFAQEN